jgi:1-acyl-sn-glycerol-3-phosphate acyltransferase
MVRKFLAAAYGIYALAAFVLVVLLFFCPLLIVAPSLRLRREIGRLTVRSWLFTCGVRLRVRGLKRLPRGPAVVVCNHASYVDGIVLTAALPARYTFLVQHKTEGWPYVGTIITRMGVRYVNRESPRAAARATLGMIRAAKRGASLAIFPEGSFERPPGLRPFFSGAFVVAARARVPVVPAVMLGTRRFFADGERWPGWSTIELQLFEPVYALGHHRAAVATLQAQVTAVMRANGEGKAAPMLKDPGTLATPGGPSAAQTTTPPARQWQASRP